MLEATSFRSHGCGELRPEHEGARVALTGWVARRRDHGGLIFLDLRDRSGMVQVVVRSEHPEVHRVAQAVRSEYVLQVTGEVRRRAPGLENPELATGAIEVAAEGITVLNEARTPPFPLDRTPSVDEGVRLRYRFLDLRRAPLQAALRLRHRAAQAARAFLDRHGFWEVETPMLTRSTPEGARDFLVPSRLQPGSFYALPQSPQLFKQLLMVSGVDRYFQITRCFRDEDLRADRQPEFTQIDVEMSFVTREDVLELMEGLVVHLFREAAGVELPRPFPRLGYEEAMTRYGVDKPDLRIPLVLTDLTAWAAGSAFQVFARAAAEGGRVVGLRVPGDGGFSRSRIDRLEARARELGARGLAWFVREAAGLRSPVARFLGAGEAEGLVAAAGLEPGDVLLAVADRPEVARRVMGELRVELGRELGVEEPGFRPCWVVDFPLFEWDATAGRWDPRHHPFTAPAPEDLDLLEQDPGRARSLAYDLVINGFEVGGGSIRIHRREVQERVFRILGLTEAEVREKFGFLLEAFEYGAPPHGGIAFGFDRLVMVLAGLDSLRDVIPFPKTASGADLLTGAPAPVDGRQLAEVGIQVVAADRPDVVS